MFSWLLNWWESWIRFLLNWITSFLSVKVIRDEKGRPFLYRYHLFCWTNDGPGLCLHRFVASDPDRGYHDHPWSRALSFILSGGYEERILNEDRVTYQTHQRNRWSFNYLNGVNSYHRVMIPEGKDAWSIFFFLKRSKTWGMIDFEGHYHAMSTQIMDQDGGWWNTAPIGKSLTHHLEHEGKVTATVDLIVQKGDQFLFIKRGKDPFQGQWALPGGRVEQKDTDLVEAALRELREETNLLATPEDLKFVQVVGNNYRDPRGFVLSTVYHLNCPEGATPRAGDDAVDYCWLSPAEFSEHHLAFDHEEIIQAVL